MHRASDMLFQLTANTLISCQRVYSGESMEPQPLELKDSDREVILIFHDESAYHANDYQHDYWLKAGEQERERERERERILDI